MQMVCWSKYLLQKAPGCDCKEAVYLTQGLCRSITGGWGYDTQEFIDHVLRANMAVVIPLKCNRKEQRNYDGYIIKKVVGMDMNLMFYLYDF